MRPLNIEGTITCFEIIDSDLLFAEFILPISFAAGYRPASTPKTENSDVSFNVVYTIGGLKAMISFFVKTQPFIPGVDPEFIRFDLFKKHIQYLYWLDPFF